jgi:ADP-ribose pyrophosphatase YjhB (NUDIX family)
MEFNKPIGSFVVLTRNNRKEIFLVKRSDFPVWEPQGGGIENNETPENTAIREAYEETGFRIKIVRKIAEYTNSNSNKITSYVFEGKYISGTFKPEYKECEGKWFKVNNLPPQMTATRKSMIIDCLLNKDELIMKSEIPAVSLQNLKLLFLLPLQSLEYIYSFTLKNRFF